MNQKQSSTGIRVRDMVRRYDTAVKTDSIKSSYSSIGPTKSSYFGLNENIPIAEDENDDFEDLYADEINQRPSPRSLSLSSSGSQKTIRHSRFGSYNDIQAISLDNQKSFMNLSRSREIPKPAPREKRPRHSPFEVEPHQQKDEDINIADASYQSKTTISKTPNGVRIIVDIFFDQNKALALEDVVGSRIETDIPPSKILKEFQRRVLETSQN